MTVRTYSNSMDAERAVTLLKKAGVSAFTHELTDDTAKRLPDGSMEQSGIQLQVVAEAAYKANQVLDVYA